MTLTLFPYQEEGVSFLELRNGRALIADEMGLGKTVQVLAWLRSRGGVRPAIVICPLSVRLHWEVETSKWVGEECYLPTGRVADGSGYWGQPFVIIHYDILAGYSGIDPQTHRIVIDPSSWLAWLQTLHPRCVVIDEAQAIRTSSIVRTKAVKALCRGVKHVIGLTGTPIVNRPIEAYNILKLVGGHDVPKWPIYTQRYCDPQHNGFVWTYDGATHIASLHRLLMNRGVMLRRRKADVLKDLPAKMRQFVPLELDNRPEYDAAERDFLSYLRRVEGNAAARRASRAETLVKINKLRSLSAIGKLDEALSWIEDMIEGNKLVAFAVHRRVINAVCEQFGERAVRLDGNTPPAERGRVIERFQTDPGCRLFVGQVQAAGTGITLTAASHICFLELPWTPGDVLQAEDRCHRIGQTDAVNIYYLLAVNTIEEKMARLIDRKRETLDALLDGAPDASPSILTELLDSYRGTLVCNVEHVS